MEAVRQLLALVVPPRCVACGAACPVSTRLCAVCRAALARAKPLRRRAGRSLDGTFCLCPHEGVGRSLIVALKLRAHLPVAALLAGELCSRAPPGLLCGALVPVPAQPMRARRRGFDPAAELARAIGRQTGLAVVPCLRRADRGRQVGRLRAMRRADPPRIAVSAAVPPEAVLVDDVRTTGATLSACAWALRGAGSVRVAAVTAAWTPSGRGLRATESSGVFTTVGWR